MNGKLPKDWEWKTLGEISLNKGQYGSGAKKVDFDGKVRYVRITDITDEGNLKEDKIVSPSTIEEDCFLEVNDLLFARSGSVGRTYLHVRKDLIYQFGGYLIRFRINPNIADTRYVFYVTKSRYYSDWVESFKKSMTLSNINAKEYASFRIPFPPLSVQKQIVSLLERAERLKEKRQKANDETKKIIQSVFYDTFGDPFKTDKKMKTEKIGNLCEVNPKKSEVKDLQDDLVISFIEMASVSNEGEIIKREDRHLSEVRKGFTYFKEGDVLFAKITPCMENGKGAIATQLSNSIGFGSTEFHILRAGQKITNKWLFALLQLPTLRKYAEKSMSGTAGQKRVTASFLANLEVPVPELSLQLKFKKIFNKLQPIKEKQKQSTEDINTLFDALMQKAFRGGLA